MTAQIPQLKLTKHESVWTVETLTTLIVLYNEKVSMKEIAERLGRSVSCCHSRLSKLRRKNLVGYHHPMSSNRMNPKFNRGPTEGDEATDNFEFIKFRRHVRFASDAMLARLKEVYGDQPRGL